MADHEVKSRAGFPADNADHRGSVTLPADTVAVMIIFGLTLALIFGSRMVSSSFGTWSHILTITELASFLVVVAFGQGLVILVRGLDLSIASMITLGGVLTTSWIGAGDGAWYMIPLVLSVCFAAGLISGIGVTLLRVPPFIMTLATGLAIYSLCLGYTRGSPRGSPPPVLVDLMSADWLGLPAVVWFVIAFAVAGALIQSSTAYGRFLYAVGNNPDAARVAGLPARLLTASAYGISAMCAGWAGMMLVGYSRGATLNMGDDYLLPSIAAVVIGGSSILGGKGNYAGTVGGALLLNTLSMLIAAIGLNHGWRMIIEGAIILLALILLREGIFEALRMPQAFRQRKSG